MHCTLNRARFASSWLHIATSMLWHTVVSGSTILRRFSISLLSRYKPIPCLTGLLPRFLISGVSDGCVSNLPTFVEVPALIHEAHSRSRLLFTLNNIRWRCLCHGIQPRGGGRQGLFGWGRWAVSLVGSMLWHTGFNLCGISRASYRMTMVILHPPPLTLSDGAYAMAYNQKGGGDEGYWLG